MDILPLTLQQSDTTSLNKCKEIKSLFHLTILLLSSITEQCCKDDWFTITEKIPNPRTLDFGSPAENVFVFLIIGLADHSGRAV
jgi:hypothetical protein